MTLRLLLQAFLLNFLLYTVLAECPEGAIEGFTEEGTAACYLYERFPAQFVTAERLCRDSHGHLASISNLFVNDFVAQGGVEAFEVMQVDNFWIGGDDLEKRGNWEWIDGADFAFTNWAENEPIDDSRSFCTAISLPEGYWSATNCYQSKPYVCEVPEKSTTTIKQVKKIKTTPIRPTRHHQITTPKRRPHPRNVTSQPPALCENGWSHLNSTNLCYKLVQDASDCYRPNTQEASIHSKSENNFVGQLALKQAKNKENVKVRLSVAHHNPQKNDKLIQEGGSQIKPWYTAHSWGLKDPAQRRQFFNNIRNNKNHKKHDSSSEEKHDTWVWFDGSSYDYSNWGKSEPKKIKTEFTCAQLNSGNKFAWSAADCLQADWAICSQPANKGH